MRGSKGSSPAALGEATGSAAALSPVQVRVKICGITNLDDARVAADAGADFIGFIFWEKSPRYVDPRAARRIVVELRGRNAATKFIGVFVDATLDAVSAALEHVDFAQLHGSESPDLLRRLGSRAFKSLRPRDADDARALVEKYRGAVNGRAPTFLVDAYHPQKIGGTGIRADGGIAAEIAREFPILLAGGLKPENVADAIRAVAPWGVDVASGVERAPGLKDHAKVRRFVENAKAESRRQ